jgi:beta-galactosidase
MNRKISRHFILVFLSFYLFFPKFQAQVRTKINFGNDWFFTRDKSLDTGWERIELPHSILLEDKVIAKQYVGKSYYKKEFSLDIKSDEKTFLYFEGVMQTATVFLNGEKISTHEGGYLPFTVELNEKLLLPNKNVISIEVSNIYNPQIPPGKPIENLDFNYFNGIYRNVYLLKTKRLYITDAVQANVVASGGINFQIANLSKEKAEGTVKIHLKNEFQSAKNIVAKIEFSNDSKEKFVFTSKDLVFKNNQTNELNIPYQIQNPKLWNIDDPKLYALKVSILEGDQILDEEILKSWL